MVRQADVGRLLSKSSQFMVFLCGLTMVGCGGSSSDSESSSQAPSDTSAATAAVATDSEPGPEAIVSEFLDGVRRGGTAADIGKLMTNSAREQYAAVGLVMQPIGAPDASFEVTRSVPWGESGALVNSLWTETDSAGETFTYQVGWAVKKEPEGWRVSGLILEDDPEPQVFNFESREDVLVLKRMQEGTPEDSAGDTARTADSSGFTMPPLN